MSFSELALTARLPALQKGLREASCGLCLRLRLRLRFRLRF